MTHTISVSRIPYGAYELKATYQKNMIFGNLVVIALVASILLISSLWPSSPMEPLAPVEPLMDGGSIVLIRPPWIVREQPDIGIHARRGATSGLEGIPRPVPDEMIEIGDETSDLFTYGAIGPDSGIALEIGTLTGGYGTGNGEVDYLPKRGKFTYIELLPEMIYKEVPEYPRLVEKMGIEGVVHVAALVLADGSVGQAEIAKSSGTAWLDEAAVKAAYKNKFKPAIQNGLPVACWVTYKVEFVIGD